MTPHLPFCQQPSLSNNLASARSLMSQMENTPSNHKHDWPNNGGYCLPLEPTAIPLISLQHDSFQRLGLPLMDNVLDYNLPDWQHLHFPMAAAAPLPTQCRSHWTSDSDPYPISSHPPSIESIQGYRNITPSTSSHQEQYQHSPIEVSILKQVISFY